MTRVVPLAAVYVALAAATAAIARDAPELALAGGSSAALAAELVVGGLLVLAALAAARARPRFAVPLAAAALAWPLAEWNTPAAGVAFTAGLVLYAAWPPLLAAAALRGPDEQRLDRPSVVLLGLAFASSVGLLGLASAAVFDPVAEGCVACPVNRVLISPSFATWHDLSQAGLALAAVWTAGFAILAVGRIGRVSSPRRRLIAPVLVPAAAAVVLFGADALHGLDRGFLSNDTTDRALWAGEIAAVALVAAGVGWGRVVAGRRRASLARLVVELGAAPTAGALQQRLAAVLRDPSLRLVHAREDGGGWVDGEGRETTPLPGDGELTPIVAAGREVSALVHEPGLLDDPALVAEIAAALRLALEHERLHALRRAQLEELRASRARIVAAADGERRRLERDLHDGAQQRLVTLAVGVRLARRRHAAGDPALDRELATAEEELRTALAELRGLAHGLFPSVLDEEGLAAAVELLAEQEPRLVLGALPGGRAAPTVESAAYYLVGEALRMSNGGDVAVDASRRDEWLLVDLRADRGFAELPIRVADRVGAAGGTVVADRHNVHAELPCAS